MKKKIFVDSGQQESCVTYSQSSSLHRCVLFLEHYIPKPYLHQKYFSKTMQPPHSFELLGTTWLAQVCQGAVFVPCTLCFRKPQVPI